MGKSLVCCFFDSRCRLVLGTGAREELNTRVQLSKIMTKNFSISIRLKSPRIVLKCMESTTLLTLWRCVKTNLLSERVSE